MIKPSKMFKIDFKMIKYIKAGTKKEKNKTLWKRTDNSEEVMELRNTRKDSNLSNTKSQKLR